MIKKESNLTYNFTAEFEKRNSSQVHMFGHIRLLFRNIRLNGNLLFRDHVWVIESKKLKNLRPGDILHFTGKIKPYIDSNELNKNKLSIVNIRNIKRIGHYKKFKRDDRPYIDNIWMKKKLEKLIKKESNEVKDYKTVQKIIT